MEKRGRVLIVAGSDCSGGAGIQADIKTVTCLGGYAATAITALTVQNTLGVSDIFEVPAKTVAAQMVAVLDDIGADAIKTGMLHRRDIIEALVAVLGEKAATLPLVVDPVMVAKGGASLIADEAVMALKNLLIPRATLITPNLPEASVLIGRDLERPDDVIRYQDDLLALGAKAVLVKGGHMAGDVLVDILLQKDGEPILIEGPRIVTRHTHGTGCTMASALATGLAQGQALEDAFQRARRYVTKAIETAPGFGQGHGPLNHGHPIG